MLGKPEAQGPRYESHLEETWRTKKQASWLAGGGLRGVMEKCRNGEQSGALLLAPARRDYEGVWRDVKKIK